MHFIRKHDLKTLLALVAVFGFFASLNIAYAGGVEDFIYKFVLGVFGMILGIAGVVFDYAVNTFVIGFGKQFLTGGVGAVVDTIWVVVRDFFNLTFIFGLVYIGFRMILNSDTSQTRRWLIYLIMAALLVNFSLFISKIVVDLSNIVATEIIRTGTLAPSPVFTSNGTGGVDITASVMDQLRLNTVFGGNGSTNLGVLTNPSSPSWGFIIGTMFLLLTASFVFFAGGIMLIIRAGALLMFMVLSPFMFAGWVFPQLSGITSSYWKGFLGRAFFAPIYMLLLLISLKILAGYTSLIAGSDFLTAFAGPGATGATVAATTIGPFILMIFFLISSLVVAQKLGADGASKAVSTGRAMYRGSTRWAGRRAGDASFGTAAWGLRNSAGWAANKYASSDTARRLASSRGLVGLAGKAGIAASSGVAKSSFDVRNAGGGAFGKSTGLGTGKKGGYAKTIEDREKREKELSKNLERNIYTSDGEVKEEYAEDIARKVMEYDSVKDTEQKWMGAQNEQAKKKQDRAAMGTADDRKSNDATIKDLEAQKAAIAAGNGDFSKLPELTKKIEERKAAIDNEFEADVKKLDAEIKAADAAVKKAKAAFDVQFKAASLQEESRVTYEHVNNLKQSRKSEHKFWDSDTMRASGLAGGFSSGAVAGAMVAGPVGMVVGSGIGALLGSSAVNARAAQADAAAGIIEKEYGRDGTKKAKGKDKQKIFKAFREAEKESGLDDAAPAASPTPSEPDTTT